MSASTSADDTSMTSVPVETLFEAALGRLSDVLTPGSFLEATPESLVVAETGGEIIYANSACERLTGFERGELLGRQVSGLLATDLATQPAGSAFETTCTRRDGDELPVEVHIGRIEGTTPLLVVTLRDRTELEEGRAARFEAEAKYRALVEHIPAVVYLDPVDEDSESIYVSPQVVELLGISQDQWLTNPYAWRHHVHPEDIERAWDEYRHAYNAHEPLNHEYRMLHENGSVRWVLEQAYPIDDESGDPWLIQGVIFDITERKRAEEQVAFLAYHDKLTGLPNRALFEEMLETAIARAHRHDLGVGVLYLDLDNFKLVNDSLGHHAGDELLIQLAERLRGCTRETDMVARQGGDEFLLLLADLERGMGPVSGTEAGVLVAESVSTRVHEALREPFDLGGVEFFASASIGVSLFPQDAADATSLLKNADTAMYQSKKSDPGGYVVYASGAEDATERLSLTTRLRRAVELQHWVLHWQPVVDLGEGTVSGAEALIRWREPNGGLVPPGEFIPIAEELGLIEAIGDWVIDEVARQRKEWETRGIDLRVGFNLSPRQLWSGRLTEKVMEKLSGAGVDPHDVVVEITESTAMADPDRTQRVLSELHAWGLTLAIDDFGTGYSSLARLKHLPVDILKIDRTFIHEVDRDEDSGRMVEAMVQLAHGLGMIPLAEGIETAEELAFLREAGCTLGQGFYFARPVPAEDIPALLVPGSLSS
jgi:diguanylate cyclase (GGDEF)-like protein/PAS domain S-box-containing protein